MKKAALKNSMQSCSNGALMRITPLCVNYINIILYLDLVFKIN